MGRNLTRVSPKTQEGRKEALPTKRPEGWLGQHLQQVVRGLVIGNARTTDMFGTGVWNNKALTFYSQYVGVWNRKLE